MSPLPIDTSPLLDPSSMRLAMGEMSGEELAHAQEVARWTWEALAVEEWVVVPKTPTNDLLWNVALRWDHGLGCEGYYDQFLGEGKHAERVAETMSNARKAHAALVGFQPTDEALVQRIAKGAPKFKDTLLTKASVGYAITSLDKVGQVALPRTIRESDIARVQRAVGESVASVDIKRLLEETVGDGFYRPGHSATVPMPSPKGLKPGR